MAEEKRWQAMHGLLEFLLNCSRVTQALIPLAKGSHSAIPDIGEGKETVQVLSSIPIYHNMSTINDQVSED